MRRCGGSNALYQIDIVQESDVASSSQTRVHDHRLEMRAEFLKIRMFLRVGDMA